MQLEQLVQVGVRIHEQWTLCNLRTSELPAIAEQMLTELDGGQFELLPLLHEISDDPRARTTAAHSPPFSDLPTTLVRLPNFRLELLVWTDGEALIHEHAFSGAFRVMQGGSIHCEYEFHETSRPGDGIRVGDLRATRAEALVTGDIRQINPGQRGLRHGLFHLERPSCTLVARTDYEPWNAPQFRYIPPNIAVSQSLAKNPTSTWATRAVRTVQQFDPSAARLWLRRYIESVDIGRAFVTALQLGGAGTLDPQEDRPFLQEIFARAHPASADALVTAWESRIEMTRFQSLRSAIADEDIRFVLAVMLTVRDPILARQVVRERFAEGTASVIDKAISELSKLLAQQRASEPEAVPIFTAIVKAALNTRTDDALLRRLSTELDDIDVEEDSDLIVEIATQIRRKPWAIFFHDQ